MSEENAERTIVKCQGQVVNVRLPRNHENPERGRLSTIALTTPEISQLGYLYLQEQSYSLGSVFEVEITLHQTSSEEFLTTRGLKLMPRTNGVKPA